MATKNIKILAIDTSCDDTGVALLEAEASRFGIISNVVSSQVKIHQKYGGVYPFLAKREHQKNLPVVFKKAVKGQKLSAVDLVGVTAGPGLEPCLWQGINFAQDLVKKTGKPLIPVNHIEAHILANFLNRDFSSVKFPAVCLVVSGGHTSLILMKRIGKYRLIGETRDDAAGECFDKTARILGLGYPGGPIISKLAKKGRNKIVLPRPMMHQKNYDFSFSGLKTAVLYNYKSQSLKLRKSDSYVRTMCFEIQQAIIDVLLYKTFKAAKAFKVKSIILGGGVVANRELRKQFQDRAKKDFQLCVPDLRFCTDNAAMVAAAAFFRRTVRLKNIKAKANLKL